jgi:hypothetical protein
MSMKMIDKIQFDALLRKMGNTAPSKLDDVVSESKKRGKVLTGLGRRPSLWKSQVNESRLLAVKSRS